MHAAPVHELPAPQALPGGALYEMKWDGWRVLVVASPGRVFLRSRTLKPLAAYFPDVVGYLRDALPPGAVVDGVICSEVVAGSRSTAAAVLREGLHETRPRRTLP
jgi:ATP-dependent DNA ligase